jgi:chaperonin GroES
MVVSTWESAELVPGRGMYFLESLAAGKTAGGIHIPESAQEGQMPRWTVLAVGPGLLVENGETVPPLYRVGDQVLMSKQAGMVAAVPMAGPEKVLAQEICILARVKGDEETEHKRLLSR